MQVTPDTLIDDIESLTMTGRSLQKEIGVSEIGMTCRRCVARKLAGIEKQLVVSSFRTTIGRWAHEGLAHDLPLLPHHAEAQDLVIENNLIVHQYKDWTLRGSCDLFAPNLEWPGSGLVVDWKVVGDDTLETTRKAVANGGAPKKQYTDQGQLYGRGYEMLGYAVSDICIMMLPANKGNLRRDHVRYQYKYDPSVAALALAKIEILIDRAETEGWDAVVHSIDPEPGCLSCPAYAVADNPQHDLLLITKSKTRKKGHPHGIR